MITRYLEWLRISELLIALFYLFGVLIVSLSLFWFLFVRAFHRCRRLERSRIERLATGLMLVELRCSLLSNLSHSGDDGILSECIYIREWLKNLDLIRCFSCQGSYIDIYVCFRMSLTDGRVLVLFLVLFLTNACYMPNPFLATCKLSHFLLFLLISGTNLLDFLILRIWWGYLFSWF